MVARAALRRSGLVGCLALVLSGCGNIQINTDIGLPACPRGPGDMSASVVLMAQAVPTSPWLPCIKSLPVGWTFTDVRARDGVAKFALNSDRAGSAAARVIVDDTCVVTGATETPSEQPGMRRFERVTRITNGYGGARYYVYDGGCITYQFNLRGNERAEPVTAVTQALGFVSRDSVRGYVQDHFGGHPDLDAGATLGRQP